jgi:hypothetical protein
VTEVVGRAMEGGLREIIRKMYGRPQSSASNELKYLICLHKSSFRVPLDYRMMSTCLTPDRASHARKCPHVTGAREYSEVVTPHGPCGRWGFISGRDTFTNHDRTHRVSNPRPSAYQACALPVHRKSRVDICGHIPHMYQSTTLPRPPGLFPDRSPAPKPMWKVGVHLGP